MLALWIVEFGGRYSAGGSRARVSFTLLGLLLFTACAQGSVGALGQRPAPSAANQVVLYLDGAEAQYETDGQGLEIIRALEDLRSLDAATLQGKRYADYAGNSGKWTLAVLLQKYFVPSQPRGIDEAALYRDAQSPQARAVIDQHLRRLRETLHPHPLP
jgi:hypothetical protein